MVSLYYKFVYAYMNYYIRVWRKAYNTLRKILLVLKNKVMRIVTNVISWTSVSPVLSNLSRFSASNMHREEHSPCETSLHLQYSIVHVHTLSSYVSFIVWYFFCKVPDIHDQYTRKSPLQHLYADSRNTTRWQIMFSFCCATIWKFILNEIDPNCSIDLFKNIFGEYFFRLVRTC